MSDKSYIKVFSATMVADRERLGDAINRWVRENRIAVDQVEIRQSSDCAFHCLSLTLRYRTVASVADVGLVYNDRLYDRIEIFSATKARDRDALGERAGALAPKDTLVVMQSSDAEFHCLTHLVFRF